MIETVALFSSIRSKNRVAATVYSGISAHKYINRAHILIVVT